MIEKIEKISRVKSIDFDVGKKFDSGRNNEDAGFAATLRRAVDKKNKSAEMSEAYSLELNSLGDSLFYFGATDFRTLLN